MQNTFLLEHFEYSTLECVITEALSHWPLTSVAEVQSHAGPSGICGGQSCIGTGISPKYLFHPVSIIPPMLHTHSFICQRHYITLTTDSHQLDNKKIQQTAAGKFFTRNLNPSITEELI